jgi:anti-anti-sigma factor
MSNANALELSQFIAQVTMEALPFAVAVYDTSETLVALNALAEGILKAPRAQLVGRVRLSDFESNPEMTAAIAAIRRALAGEHVTLASVRLDLDEVDSIAGGAPKGAVWLEARYFPLRDAEGRVRFVMLVNTDQTELVREREALEALREEIAAQRETIRALSSPIIEVWRGILALPVIGAVDAERAADMMTRLLESVSSTRASRVILDLTGVGQIDSTTADHIVKILRAVELLGAQGILVGIQPAISRTLVALDTNLSPLRTFRTLGDALQRCLEGKIAEGASAQGKF